MKKIQENLPNRKNHKKSTYRNNLISLLILGFKRELKKDKIIIIWQGN